MHVHVTFPLFSLDCSLFFTDKYVMKAAFDNLNHVVKTVQLTYSKFIK